MTKNRKIFLSTLLGMLFALAAGLGVGSALDLRHAVLTDERVGTKVRMGDTTIEWSSYMLEHVARLQLNRAAYFLVTRRDSVLWAAIYLLAGLAGGFASIWLALAGIRMDLRPSRTWPRLAVSAVSGVLVYLLLRLPAPLLSQFASIKLLRAGEALTQWSLLDSCTLLAVLAGLFTSAFYDRLEDSFRSMLTRDAKGG